MSRFIFSVICSVEAKRFSIYLFLNKEAYLGIGLFWQKKLHHLVVGASYKARLPSFVATIEVWRIGVV